MRKMTKKITINFINKSERLIRQTVVKSSWVVLFLLICIGISGCGAMKGYSSEPVFPAQLNSVYVEMFDNRSFWRGIEYELTDALAKRIEAQTPYKIVSNRDKADSVISGQIIGVTQSVISSERQTGRALEKDVELRVIVSWKDLKTGQLLLDSASVSDSASFSEWQNQSFSYASTLAANNLAKRIVELMEKPW
ncbi:MAG: LptE family protein [Planctomycetota bacterium]|jgi:hypothetical protein